jgi:hypothetical protein
VADLANTGDDERFFLHSGRRWRKTDPSLPEDVRKRLMSHLGRGRSGVRNSARGDDGAALPRARRTVQLAKEGLGERGTPWWEQSAAERTARWTAALEELDALHAKRSAPRQDGAGRPPTGAASDDAAGPHSDGA